MAEGPDIARLAHLIADPARANMLINLLGVPAMTAGELASRAGVTAQTASGHLRLLTEAGLLDVRQQGRHRYYQFAREEVAELLEGLLGHADRLGFVRKHVGPNDPAMRLARTCYDHMAGRIAVDLFQRMRSTRMVEGSGAEVRVTPDGRARLIAIGIPEAVLDGGKRAACRECMDWSERRVHLAGGLGAALLIHATDRKWVVRQGRVLIVTPAGERGFATLFVAPGGAGMRAADAAWGTTRAR